MHHLILGYGYCGYHLARLLLKANQSVTGVSRHLPDHWQLPQLQHISHDLSQGFEWATPDTIVYYMIPPQSEGTQDVFLKHCLEKSQIKAKKIVYFGSSAVYGNHQGGWVNEESMCKLDKDRQQRRLDAEQQWLAFGKANQIPCVLLRIAGIYGPQRLPVDAALARTAILNPKTATYTNAIYVKDLVAIAYFLGKNPNIRGIYNVADGEPKPMGALQQEVTKALNLEPAPYESWDDAWQKASAMKQEFMTSSKRLRIDKLAQVLGSDLMLTPMNEAIAQSLLEDFY